MANAKKRKIVKGIEHGLSGYTNYSCRCDVCTVANAEHSREYRSRRFAGSPLCVVGGCPHIQSRSYGNGLCYNHARQALDFRDELETMSRLDLKRIIRRNDLEIRVLKRISDDDLRRRIEEALGPAKMAQLAEAA